MTRRVGGLSSESRTGEKTKRRIKWEGKPVSDYTVAD